MADLKGIRIAILATNGVEQAELMEPRKFLDQLGARTTVLSPQGEPIQAMQHHEKADKIPANGPIESARASDYDAVLLPGGALNADALRMSQDARRFMQDIDRAGKPVAVICHAPWLLVSAGLVKGRHMTSYHTIQDDLRNAGAHWEDKEVIRDRNWVSSRKPSDIPVFNREMAELFSEGVGKKAA